MSNNTFLLLGRSGDLCAVLPFLKMEPERPRLVVSNQHSPLLEGVSYVDVVEFDGGVHLLKEAFGWAKSKFGAVRSLQVMGNGDVLREVTYRPAGVENARTTSFVKEMWRCAGRLGQWDEVWPLVFDKRNPEREARLVEKYLPKRMGRPKKLMLVFIESHSSPFPYKTLLVDLLQLQFSKSHNIVVNPQAERFFDLLALYEKAHLVVCVDSAPLHLARAVPTLPVIALTNDQPGLWNGSPWMPQHRWYCRYHDFPNKAIQMAEAIRAAWWECSDGETITVTTGDYQTSVDAVVVGEGMTGRDARSLGDEKKFPFLKDCLRMGLQRAKDDQPVCLLRGDVSVVESHLSTTSPIFAYRMERNGDECTFHPIVDLFCAPKSWWKARLTEIPDYIFGRDHFWSNGLWALFKKHHAIDRTGICTRTTPKA